MEVLELSELVEFKPGEVIFSERDSGDRMYIVRSGEIEVIKRINGDPVIITRMGPDEIFGEMALVEQRPRSATIRAVTAVECQLIGGEVFRHRWAEVPAWMQDLYGLVIERLRVTTRKYNPHSGRIPGFQIVELLCMLARESEIAGSPDAAMPMKMIIDRMTYMFDIPQPHVRMILELLLDSSLLSSEFDASREDKIVAVDLPKLEKFGRYVQKIDPSQRVDGGSTGNAQAEEYEFLNLLNRVYEGQSKISTSEEKVAGRLNTRVGKSLSAYRETIATLLEAGIWSEDGESGVEIDLDMLRERLATLQQNSEFPWLSGRILALSHEVADTLAPERTSASTANIVKGLTGS